MILSDISTGHHELSDVLLLVAFVVAVIAIVIEVVPDGRGAALWRPLMAAAVAVLALAWLVL